MSQEIDVQAELTNRLKAYFDSTLRSKMNYPGSAQITSIDVSGVKFSLLSLDYDDLKNVPIVPKSLVTKEFRNDSNATIHSTFQQTEQSSDSFKWSLTQGLKLGASAKFKRAYPLLATQKPPCLLSYPRCWPGKYRHQDPHLDRKRSFRHPSEALDQGLYRIE
jgi:hypothetical protein